MFSRNFAELGKML